MKRALQAPIEIHALMQNPDDMNACGIRATEDDMRAGEELAIAGLYLIARPASPQVRCGAFDAPSQERDINLRLIRFP